MLRPVLSIALLGVALPAFATNGYFSHGYGTASKGEGGVGIALGRDALTIATNPAGLIDAPDGLEVGFDTFAPRREATLQQGGTTARFDGNGTRSFLIPEAGYSRHIGNRLAAGVALFGHGGMNTDYRANPFARFGAQGRAGIDLSQAFVSPALAWKVSEAHSIGLALNLVYQRFRARGVGLFAAFSEDPAHVSDQGYDGAFGAGLRLGWVGHLSDAVTLGAAWQSKTQTGRFKKYSGLFADQGSFDIPETYGLGVAVRPTSALTLALDWQRILYADVPAVGNPIDSLFSGVPLGASGGPGFGWRNVSVWKLGGRYQLNEALALSAGVNTNQQPVQQTQTFINILAPGTVRTHATLGATWKLTNASDVSVSYLHAFAKSVHGAGSIPAAFGGGEANLRLKENSLGFSYRYRFDVR